MAWLWWTIARQYGPFDAAFLSINEAVVEDSGMTPSGIPITMSPEQAVAAAVILNAKRLVPIHYHVFKNPPRYIEGENLLLRLSVEGKARGQHVLITRQGERINPGSEEGIQPSAAVANETGADSTEISE